MIIYEIAAHVFVATMPRPRTWLQGRA